MDIKNIVFVIVQSEFGWRHFEKENIYKPKRTISMLIRVSGFLFVACLLIAYFVIAWARLFFCCDQWGQSTKYRVREYCYRQVNKINQKHENNAPTIRLSETLKWVNGLNDDI